jgi:hypothetical protein
MMFALVHLLSRVPKVCEKGNVNVLKFQQLTRKEDKDKFDKKGKQKVFKPATDLEKSFCQLHSAKKTVVLL